MIGNSSEKNEEKKSEKIDGPQSQLELSIKRIKKNLVKKLNTELNENLSLIGEINDLLLASNIVPEEAKLDYCKSQRYFMKQYLKYISLKYGL